MFIITLKRLGFVNDVFGLVLLIAVARWDDIEWPSTQVMESRSVEGATTGYVPDEW